MYKRLPALLLQFSAACLMCCCVLLFLEPDAVRNLAYPLVFVPCAVLLYAADVIYLRKPRELLHVALLSAFFIVASMAVIIVVAGLRGFMPMVYALLFLLWIAALAFRSAQNNPTMNTLMLTVELSMVMLVVFASFCSARGLDSSLYFIPVAACTASILSITMQRMDARPSLRSALMLLFVFAVLFLLLWLMLTFVAAPAGGGLIAVWHFIVSIAKLIAAALLWLITALAELFPTKDVELPPPEAAGSMSVVGEAVETRGGEGVIALLVILAAAALVYFVLKLRHIKVKSNVTADNAGRYRSRIGLKTALLRLLRAIHERIKLEIRLFKARKTPGGVLIRITRLCRRTRLRRRTGETAREFLSRLRDGSAEDERLSSALAELIPMVDREVFSAAHERTTVQDAEYILRRLRLMIVKDSLSQIGKSKKIKETA